MITWKSNSRLCSMASISKKALMIIQIISLLKQCFWEQRTLTDCAETPDCIWRQKKRQNPSVQLTWISLLSVLIQASTVFFILSSSRTSLQDKTHDRSSTSSKTQEKKNSDIATILDCKACCVGLGTVSHSNALYGRGSGSIFSYYYWWIYLDEFNVIFGRERTNTNLQS